MMVLAAAVWFFPITRARHAELISKIEERETVEANQEAPRSSNPESAEVGS